MELPYYSLSLDDLDGEIWIDAICYDGIYEVSNYGRIKSIPRLVATNQGRERMVKERILKTQIAKSCLKVPLSSNGVKKNVSVSNLVYLSFNKDSPKRPNEVIMHIDKNFLNNNLDNLKVVSCKESTYQNFIKGKQTKEKCKVNLIKATEKTVEFYKNRTSKTCNICNLDKPLKYFIKEHNECKICYNAKQREKRTEFIETRTELKCGKCKEIKPINQFQKHNKTKCKKCTNLDAIEYRNRKLTVKP